MSFCNRVLDIRATEDWDARNLATSALRGWLTTPGVQVQPPEMMLLSGCSIPHRVSTSTEGKT